MAHPIDILVGKRLRQIRRIRKISQADLEEKVSVTFQQVQKYEKAVNRISASKLWLLAEVLEINVTYFFEGINRQSPENSPILSDTAYELGSLFDSLSDETVQKHMLHMLRAMVNSHGDIS